MSGKELDRGAALPGHPLRVKLDGLERCGEVPDPHEICLRHITCNLEDLLALWASHLSSSWVTAG